MWLPTRESNHNVDSTVSDVMQQALRDGATVEIVSAERGWAIEIDGIRVAPIATESFDYPLKRFDFNEDAEELVLEMLKRRRRRRFERRKKKLNTDNHTQSEGVDL